MDALDRLAGPATELLGRVDDLLTGSGAPPEHRIWPLVRRTGTLPGAALAAVAALRPGPPGEAADVVRRPVRAYESAAAALTGPVDWTGPAAEAFAVRRSALAARVSGGADSLAGRLHQTADFAAALAHWAARARDRLARTLAEVLGSAEAVTVVTGGFSDPGGAAARAGAEIGARILAAVVEVQSDGDELLRRYDAVPAESPPFAPDAATAYRWDSTTRVRR
ncbi:hypothetical protein ACFFWC_15980 [Plantactinospora siamensis]|uniref:Uncharacterized protein n=1 Tax=Plantactinospora siamensis TaxID=555372 RepID=A0ABV6NVP4_9ACTN